MYRKRLKLLHRAIALQDMIDDLQESRDYAEENFLDEKCDEIIKRQRPLIESYNKIIKELFELTK